MTPFHCQQLVEKIQKACPAEYDKPQLQHVLKVLAQIAGEWIVSERTLDVLLSVDTLEFDYWSKEEGEIILIWNLSQPLCFQPEETKVWLWNLLCNS